MKKSFLCVRLFELFAGNPRWCKSLGQVLLDVKHPGLKMWYLLAHQVNGGFEDLQLKVVE